MRCAEIQGGKTPAHIDVGGRRRSREEEEEEEQGLPENAQSVTGPLVVFGSLVGRDCVNWRT